MAKRNGATKAAPATTPGQSVAASLATRAADPSAEPAVIEWDVGNGVSAFAAGELPPDVRAAEAEGQEAAEAAPVVTGTPAAGAPPAKTETVENQGDGSGEGGTVSPVAAAPKPGGAEARRRTFAALDSERGRVALETQARENRERAERSEAEIARIKKLPIKEQLAYLGIDRESLEEQLIVGGEAVADLPAKKAPQADPVVEELRTEVRTLKERDNERQHATNMQAISQSHQIVSDALKDIATVPMVKGVRDIVIDGTYVHSGIDLTLKTAVQAWNQAGKAGHPRDYIAGAAEVVEEHLRAARPDLAAVFVPAPRGAGGGQQPAPAPASNGTASIGKRTAARPEVPPKDLPQNRYERDQAIKKEMGWS